MYFYYSILINDNPKVKNLNDNHDNDNHDNVEASFARLRHQSDVCA